jgi:spoIIIJ-associated protein
MEQIITSGKNKKEAIEKALGELGLRRSEVRVEILEAGSRGFFGLGSKGVKLRVSKSDGDGPLPDDLNPEKVARGILDPLNIDYKLDVRREEDAFFIKITSKRDEGLLIGRRGQTLDAIKHLVQRILTSQAGQTVSVNLEVGDYRERREEALHEKAEAVAVKVIEAGKSLSLEPMTAQDRRIVHMVLADREDLRTYTAGDGSRRRVVVALADEADSPRSKREPASPYEDIPDPGFRSTSISSMAEPREDQQEAPTDHGSGRRAEGRESRDEERPRRRNNRREERSNDERRPRRNSRRDEVSEGENRSSRNGRGDEGSEGERRPRRRNNRRDERPEAEKRPRRDTRKDENSEGESQFRQGSRRDRHREEGGTRIRKTFRKEGEEKRPVADEPVLEAKPARPEPQELKITEEKRPTEQSEPREVKVEPRPERPIAKPEPVNESSEAKPFSSNLAKSVLGFEEGKGKPAKKRRYR